jgi:hypothetical protein
VTPPEELTVAEEGPSEDEPTLLGWSLRDVSVGLPDLAAEHRHRMLGHHLHVKTAHDLRHIRLGPIIELVVLDGEPPGWDRYDEFYEQRKSEGDPIPTRKTLKDHYGGYVAAVAAAMDLFSIGVARSSRRHSAPRSPYTPGEIEDAIIDCMLKLDHWPAQQEFLLWVDLERRARRLAREVEPRLPSIAPLRRLYGKEEPYTKARRAAERAYHQHPDKAARQAHRRTAAERYHG